MQCALFDLDGTIADTEVLKAKALSESIRKLGGNSPPEIYKKVMGKSWEVVTNTFLRHSNLESTLEQLNPLFRESYSKLIESELEDTRDAAFFLQRFNEKNFKLGLVSSASPWMIEKSLKKLRLPVSFDVIVSNADITKHKPDPEAYILSLNKLNLSADKAIAFEDSESGFQAASAAGIKVIGIKHSYNEFHDFSLCHRVYDGFDQINLSSL
jgi:beta-phosphoglucomutase-like phosphatase (HAD superfamily)